MLKINLNEKSYEIRNSMNELLIKEFEYITSLLNDKEKQYFEKWSEIFVYLGLPQDVVDSFDTFAFIDIIKEFNIFNQTNTDIVKEIKIGDDSYVSYNDTFKITVKDMSMIEYYIGKNDKRYIGEVMAILYKRPGFDKTLNYDKAHIHHKAELFRNNITADNVVPVITFLSKKLVVDYELVKE